MTSVTPDDTGYLLDARDVSVHFGGVKALDGVTLRVRRGSVHGLVGPNGSGKTTLINCISGFVRPSGGSISFDGTDVSAYSTTRRARAGIARTFQHPRCFEELDAAENVDIGSHTEDGVGWLRALEPRSNARGNAALTERSAVVLDRVGVDLSERRTEMSSAPYGIRRLVDAARAVVRRPQLVLLDEPAAGLGGADIDNLARTVRWLVDEGMTVLITDHNMDFMMGICDVLTVLDFGRQIAEGTPQQVRTDERVIAAYLGTGGGSRPDEEVREVGGVAEVAEATQGGRLVVEELVAGYSAGPVLHGLSLRLEPGQVRAIVGANGAGKSTTLLTLSGIVRPQVGRVTLDGDDVHGLAPAAVVRRGVAHVPEGRRVLTGLTVAENLMMGAYTVRDRKLVEQRLDDVYQLLPILAERRKQLAGSLSGGEQQMLAIARALMSGPRVLLLDEPTMGLAPIMVDRVLTLVRRLRARGLAIGLVEQNATVALGVSDHAYVLRAGRIVASGTPAELEASDALQQAYLGTEAHAPGRTA
jgi:ABC-type branched-subunit amino acid transport system ATPase component